MGIPWSSAWSAGCALCASLDIGAIRLTDQVWSAHYAVHLLLQLRSKYCRSYIHMQPLPFRCAHTHICKYAFFALDCYPNWKSPWVLVKLPGNVFLEKRSSLLNRNASSGLVILAEFRNFLQCLQANVRIDLADRLRPFLSAHLVSSEQRICWNEIQIVAIWQIFTHFRSPRNRTFHFMKSAMMMVMMIMMISTEICTLLRCYTA